MYDDRAQRIFGGVFYDHNKNKHQRSSSCPKQNHPSQISNVLFVKLNKQTGRQMNAGKKVTFLCGGKYMNPPEDIIHQLIGSSYFDINIRH